jgi:hypothetical protein
MCKPRKSQRYVADIATLLRDVQPTNAEIEGEADPDRRQKRRRACEIATDELIRISRDRKVFNQLSRSHQLEVQWFIKELKRFRREFPTQKGGRRRDDHRRLLIAVKMAELVDVGATVPQAVKLVRQWHNERFDKPIAAASVRAIHFRKNPEWQGLVQVERARRAYDEASVDKAARRAAWRAALPTIAQLDKPKRKAIVT